MIDTDKYEGHTPGPWEALLNHPQVDGSCVVSDEDESNFGYTDGERILGPLWVGELTDDMPDTKLIADAPLLLEEYKRLMHCLRYVGARLYLDKNGYRPCDYYKLLEFCMDNTGEPDDMSGEMSMMIRELMHLDEKLEDDKEMIE
jgi:hypothetical protein